VFGTYTTLVPCFSLQGTLLTLLQCVIGTLGVPPTCVRCSSAALAQDGVRSCFGLGFVLEKGYYPVLAEWFKIDQARTVVDWVDALTLVPCASNRISTPCNSGGTCEVSAPTANSALQIRKCTETASPSNMCDVGYSDFLCSRCTCEKPLELGGGGEECYYRSGNRCVPCGLPSAGVLLLCLVLGFVLLIFVNFLHFAGFLVSVEIIGLCVVAGVAPDTWWLLDILIGVLMMQFVTRSTSHRDAETQRSKIKLSGLFKSIIFFVQTTASLNENMWPEKILQTFGVQLDIANLNFRGLECVWPELFNNSIVQLLFAMGMPLVLLAVALLVFSFVWFIQWFRDLILLRCGNKERKRPESIRWFALRCARATLFLLYISYFNMVNKILAVFNCESVASRTYVSSRPYQRCSTNSGSEWAQLSVFAFIFTATHVIGIPLLFTVLLILRQRRNRAKAQATSLHSGGVRSLDEAASRSSLDEVLVFLTENYDDDGWWFDIVFIFRRLALSALIFAIPASVARPYQIAGVSLVILLSCSFQVAVQPLRSTVHNFLELCSLIVIGITYATLLGIRMSGTEPDDIVWIVFALNAGMILAFGIAVSVAARYWQHLAKSLRTARKIASLERLRLRGSWRSENVGVYSDRSDMSVTLVSAETSGDLDDALGMGVDTLGRTTLDQAAKQDRTPLLSSRD
jgi:hypothetical protein